jgi:hypothetical protein
MGAHASHTLFEVVHERFNTCASLRRTSASLAFIRLPLHVHRISSMRSADERILRE